jgi:integrase
MKERGVFERPPGSDIWWIHWHDHLGKRHREKAGTKSSAIKLYRKRKTEELQRKKLPETIRQRGVIFQEIADDAIAWSEKRKRSYKNDRTRLKYLKEWFGDRLADSVTPDDIEKRLFALKRSNATRNRYKAALSFSYRLAIRSKKVSINPARLVPRFPENNERVRFLSEEEEAELRSKISETYPERMADLDFALHTGTRFSEQYELDFGQVDFLNRVVNISRSKHGEPRHVHLNVVALEAIMQRHRQNGGKGKVFERKDPRSWFNHAAKAAGISNFTWHDLRHTFASRLVMAGVDLRTVQELMGHKTMAVTIRYAHLAPSHQARAVEKLASIFGTATTTATRVEQVS